jgi:hypothetical protein
MDTPAFSASLAAGLNSDFPTSTVSDAPTEGKPAGSPIAATATGFQGTAIGDTVVIAVDGAQTATQTFALTVVNDNAPVIRFNGAGTSSSVNVFENTAAVTTIMATDPDAGATLTYSIVGGADSAKFTGDASTGALSFSAPDYEWQRGS